MGPALAAVMAASMAGGALFPRNPAPTPPAPFSLFASPTEESDRPAPLPQRSDEVMLRRQVPAAKVPASPLGDFPLLVDETRVC